MEEHITFTQWSGENGIEKYIINKTGCKPFSGAGINPRIDKKTTILRSVENTYYYHDDTSNINIVKYTLFGTIGNQDENEKIFNEPLLNINKTKHIYLYLVRPTNKQHKYVWYGKYIIIDKEIKIHTGKDKILRNIIVLTLKKIDD